ncbi:MAG: c-type cytochrome [Pseudomonadota bacterium]
MSKFLSLIVPSIGGAALVLGGAYGFASRDYGQAKIDNLTIRIAQTEAHVASAIERARMAEAEAKKADTERELLKLALADAASMRNDLATLAPVHEMSLGLGRPAHVDEIAAWDVDVLPDGRGLPPGRGDVWTGEEVFVEQCASCHGDFAEGVGNWPVLAGGLDTLADKDPVKTVGSYWPHLSTAWDYINRSMPFGAAGTLTADETYAIVAYILYSNDLVGDDFVLSDENFAEFEMYNANGFVIDDRSELEYSAWRGDPCMSNCKDMVEITMRATFLDVTPEGGGVSVMNHAAASDAPVFGVSASEDVVGGENAELFAAGERAFRQCSSCHAVGEGARNSTGPALNGIVNASIGAVDGFRYSGIFQDAAAAGDVWDQERLTAFLGDPKGAMPGTKMAFRGMRDQEDIDALIAYLATFEVE